MSSLQQPRRDEVPLNLYRVSSPGTARIVSNVRLTPDNRDDVRHLVVDLEGLNYHYVEGQSLGVLPPGFDKNGRPYKLRLFSIASTRNGDDGRGTSASLCVKRVVFFDPSTGEDHYGIASNYLCDAKPGDQISITGPSGKTLLLPDDPASNLIMVATGTGIAPFRAFLRRIYLELPEWTGTVYLFFGVRTEAECIYREELEALLDHPGSHFITAFSREQSTPDGKRLYVQHCMSECIEELWSLLALENTYIYICGMKGMESGVVEVLAQHAHAIGTDWDEFHNHLKKSGRLLIETY
jgi:ferredoxin--NADP+ reductase